MNTKTFVGIDLHKTTLTIGVRPACRQAGIVNGELTNTISMPTKCVNKIEHLFSHLPSPVYCAIESVGMYEWLWNLLEPKVDRLVLADAVPACRQAGNSGIEQARDMPKPIKSMPNLSLSLRSETKFLKPLSLIKLQENLEDLGDTGILLLKR